MREPNRYLRAVFLYVVPVCVTLFALTFAVCALFGLGLFETGRQLTQLFTDRAPYIVQALVNLALLYAVCLCGAMLYSRRAVNTRRGLLAVAAVSAICAVLMHAMVYGIVFFIPAPYTLLTPDHITLRLFAGPDTAPFASNPALCHAFGAVSHALAPQVLLGLAVSALALRRRASMPRPPRHHGAAPLSAL